MSSWVVAGRTALTHLLIPPTQAIKVFSKSLLLRRKKFQRGQQGRMAVVTDLDKVSAQQRERGVFADTIHTRRIAWHA